MSRRTYRRSYSRRRTNNSGNPIERFFRRPAVQLSILGIAVLIVVLLVLSAQGH